MKNGVNTYYDSRTGYTSKRNYTTTKNFHELITRLNIVRMNISKLALEEEVIKGKIRHLKQVKQGDLE